MILVDTHAHLYAQQFDKDRADMIQRAIDTGVERLFLPNIDHNSISGMYQLVDTFPKNCFPMMGIHPCSIKENYKEELARAKEELNKAPDRFYAVGEIGLDFYWDLTFKEQQKDALRTQITWAKKHKLPIVLHCRDSFQETLDIVSEMNDDNLTGIFHCFGGTIEEAEQVMALSGFYMGIGGVLTYKKSKLDEVLKHVPLEYLVLETDAPYLAPEPYRSSKKKHLRRNESAYILKVAEKLAEVKDISLDEVARITTANADTVFQLN